MIVYNTLRRRGRGLLLRVLESSLQVPYDALIVVDDGSDGTGRVIAEWARGHGVEVRVERSRPPPGSRPTRATARQRAIDVFLSEYGGRWLFFLDDDAVLREGWWGEAEPHTRDPRVGLIWGIDWPAGRPPGDPGAREAQLRGFMERGGMHDTLIRRGALEGMPPIPPGLHVFEDAWVYWWVRCSGWEVRVLETGVIHYGGDDPFTSVGAGAILEAYRLLGVTGDPRPGARRDYESPVKPLLLVARPILGFLAGLPHALASRRLRRHARVQWNKLRARVYLALARLRYGPPGDPCRAFTGRGGRLSS